MNIVCRLPGHDEKKFDVSTSDRNTVAGLIRKACKESNIPMRSSYMLLDRREKALQWSQSLTHCGVKHGDTLYLTCEGRSLIGRGVACKNLNFVYSPNNIFQVI